MVLASRFELENSVEGRFTVCYVYPLRYTSMASRDGFEPPSVRPERTVLPLNYLERMALGLGFEPRLTVPKTAVLPLNYPRTIDISVMCDTIEI